MEEHFGRRIDWASRLLGLTGILLGGAALGYAYSQHQVRKTEIEAVQRQSNSARQLAEEIRDRPQPDAKQFAADWTQWDERLVQALEEFKRRANEVVEKDEQARAERDAAVREQLAGLTPASDLDALVEQKYAALQARLAAPRLRVARGLLKPVSAADARAVVVKNDGNREAELTRVVFQPTSQFEDVDGMAGQRPLSSPDRLVIRFSREHNQATQAERHAEYVQELAEPAVVPGNSYVRLLVEIENSLHVGWGFEGRLTITYDDGQTLEIPEARALFVAETDASI